MMLAFIFIGYPSFHSIISPPLITVQCTPIMRDVFATSIIQIDSCFFGTFLVFNQFFFSIFIVRYDQMEWLHPCRLGFYFFPVKRIVAYTVSYYTIEYNHNWQRIQLMNKKYIYRHIISLMQAVKTYTSCTFYHSCYKYVK